MNNFLGVTSYPCVCILSYNVHGVAVMAQADKASGKAVRRLFFTAHKNQVLSEAAMVFVARAFATSVRQSYLGKSCDEIEEPTSTDLAISLGYATLLVLPAGTLLLIWCSMRERQRAENLDAPASKCPGLTAWEQQSSIVLELIAWSFKDASAICFTIFLPLLFSQTHEESGSGSGAVLGVLAPEEGEDTERGASAWDRIAAHLALFAILLAVALSGIAVLPAVLQQFTVLARRLCAMLGICQGTRHIEGELGSELAAAVRAEACFRAVVAAVSLSTAFQLSSAVTKVIEEAGDLRIWLLVGYCLLLSVGGGLVLGSEALTATTSAFAQYIAFADKLVGFLCGWALAAAVDKIAEGSTQSYGLGPVGGHALGAVAVTFYCATIIKVASGIRVERRLWLLIQLHFNDGGAVKIARFLTTASALAVGWAWEEVSERLQCDLARRAGSHLGVEWAYTLAVTAIILPCSVRLGEAHTRGNAEFKAAYVEYRGEQEPGSPPADDAPPQTGRVPLLKFAAEGAVASQSPPLSDAAPCAAPAAPAPTPTSPPPVPPAIAPPAPTPATCV